VRSTIIPLPPADNRLLPAATGCNPEGVHALKVRDPDIAGIATRKPLGL
jgi:hypothetical protein